MVKVNIELARCMLSRWQSEEILKPLKQKRKRNHSCGKWYIISSFWFCRKIDCVKIDQSESSVLDLRFVKEWTWVKFTNQTRHFHILSLSTYRIFFKLTNQNHRNVKVCMITSWDFEDIIRDMFPKKEFVMTMSILVLSNWEQNCNFPLFLWKNGSCVSI